MSNRTYVCTACRVARRGEAAGGLKTAFRCPSCGGALWELSHKWRIPKKEDDRGWRELDEQIAASRPARESFIRRRGEDIIRKLDVQIGAFAARKPSEQRDAILKDLKKERMRIVAKYSGNVLSLPGGEPGFSQPGAAI